MVPRQGDKMKPEEKARCLKIGGVVRSNWGALDGRHIQDWLEMLVNGKPEELKELDEILTAWEEG